MTNILQQALKISELKVDLVNISSDDKRELTSYSDAEILAEARYVLSTYYEGGHHNNDELSGEYGADAVKEARRQVNALKRLVR
jgi:hypothetical protein